MQGFLYSAKQKRTDENPPASDRSSPLPLLECPHFGLVVSGEVDVAVSRHEGGESTAPAVVVSGLGAVLGDDSVTLGGREVAES